MQQVREDSEGIDRQTGIPRSLSVKNSLSSRYCGGPGVGETPHCQDPWLRADMEAAWGALGKGGPGKAGAGEEGSTYIAFSRPRPGLRKSRQDQSQLSGR